MILHNAFLNRFYSFATFIESYSRVVWSGEVENTNPPMTN